MDNGNTGPLSALGPQLQMAQFIIGPMLADEETRDGIRDSTAEMMSAVGIDAVTIHRNGARDLYVDPRTLAEMLMSRLAAECGFTIPGYAIFVTN